MMRATLSLDDDVVAKLQTEARRSGRTFKDVVNEALRRGLTPVKATTLQPPFEVTPRGVGACPQQPLDKIAERSDQIVGAAAR